MGAFEERQRLPSHLILMVPRSVDEKVWLEPLKHIQRAGWLFSVSPSSPYREGHLPELAQV